MGNGRGKTGNWKAETGKRKWEGRQKGRGLRMAVKDGRLRLGISSM
jgi:hypothetical protein